MRLSYKQLLLGELVAFEVLQLGFSIFSISSSITIISSTQIIKIVILPIIDHLKKKTQSSLTLLELLVYHSFSKSFKPCFGRLKSKFSNGKNALIRFGKSKIYFWKKKKKKKLGDKPHKNKKYLKNYFIKEANWCPNMFPEGT